MDGSISMRKSKWVEIFLLSLLMMAVLCSCKKEDPKEYANTQIEMITSGDKATAQLLLERGIDSVKDSYIEEFPETLKKDYRNFLEAALKQVEFQILDVKKHNADYKVSVEVSAVDVGETTGKTDEDQAKKLETTDLAKEVSGLLKKDSSLLDTPVRKEKKTLTLTVKKNSDGFQMEDAGWEILMDQILYDYMQPYKEIADTLEAGRYLQASLNASLKGQVTDYCKFTGETQEEAQAEYEQSFTDSSEDPGFSGEREARFEQALKTMFASSQYEVGIPRKADGDGYVVPVTYQPNLSLKQAMDTFQANVNQGMYGSQDQAEEGFISVLESYAAAPVYGETQTKEVHYSRKALRFTAGENEDYQNLTDSLIPTE